MCIDFAVSKIDCSFVKAVRASDFMNFRRKNLRGSSDFLGVEIWGQHVPGV